ncbi:MAG TPA: hypothetical protein VK211_07695 [Kamptonema sp.]|nr:hypothetical protein [Kamptonema sp.]
MRIEDHVPMAETVIRNYRRHQAEIMARFPNCNDALLAEFEAALEQVRKTESGYAKLEEQKEVTRRLYADAEKLNREIDFTIGYLKRVQLDTDGTRALRNDLQRSNIEGAIEKIAQLLPYYEKHAAALTAEGMPKDFLTELRNWAASFSASNLLQSELMDERKHLTAHRRALYAQLHDYVDQFLDCGKRVFKGSPTADEFMTVKILGRMHR